MFDRVVLIVLDGFGIGSLQDAAVYGDVGAHTFRSVLRAERPALPNLRRMGLFRAARLTPDADAADGAADATSAAGGAANAASGAASADSIIGAYGRAAEMSPGKDTTTGHWEIAGLRLTQPFPTYPDGFPPEVIDAFERRIGRGVLGNKPASGTAILAELGAEHLRTGKPIVYTSADSVFQIACHEDIYAPEALYGICRDAREILTGRHAVARVIARPFTGVPGAFTRTSRRRDFSLPPIGETVLDALSGAGFETVGVGKIEDIFCQRGLTRIDHVTGNPDCMRATEKALAEDFRGLVFTNLVDTDMVYGHRRDCAGYAGALSAFDAWLTPFMARLRGGDLLIVTADHGCDPGYAGTDHTREYVPVLCWHSGMRGATELGDRATFSDIAATVAENFGLAERFGATSFLSALGQPRA